jgi:hypothetical protein
MPATPGLTSGLPRVGEGPFSAVGLGGADHVRAVFLDPALIASVFQPGKEIFALSAIWL